MYILSTKKPSGVSPLGLTVKRLINIVKWIDRVRFRRVPLPAMQFEVKVRSCRFTGIAHIADELSFMNTLSFADKARIKVRVYRCVYLAVDDMRDENNISVAAR